MHCRHIERKLLVDKDKVKRPKTKNNLLCLASEAKPTSLIKSFMEKGHLYHNYTVIASYPKDTFIYTTKKKKYLQSSPPI